METFFCIVRMGRNYGADHNMLSTQTAYAADGVALDTVKQELLIDLSEPRTIIVRGVNERTGETKTYMLRVTGAGRLILN